MIYGVKVIHTYMVGEDDQRFYEELILRVKAQSFDEAYEKAEKYMRFAYFGVFLHHHGVKMVYAREPWRKVKIIMP